MKYTLLLLLILTSCGNDNASLHTWQTFPARDNGIALERVQLYRAKIPQEWIRKDPPTNESIADTMKSNCEFIIMDKIRLTIYTFPINERRIPAQAQVQRWKSQFTELDPLLTTVTSQANGGFIGLLLEAQGQINGQEQTVLGWSMNLANEYETKLRISSQPVDQLKRADYTIKIVGPSQLVHKNRKALMAFTRSFELIDELPAPL